MANMTLVAGDDHVIGETVPLEQMRPQRLVDLGQLSEQFTHCLAVRLDVQRAFTDVLSNLTDEDAFDVYHPRVTCGYCAIDQKPVGGDTHACDASTIVTKSSVNAVTSSQSVNS